MEDGLPDDHGFLFPETALCGSSAMISASHTGMLKYLLVRKPSFPWCTKRAPIFPGLRGLLVKVAPTSCRVCTRPLWKGFAKWDVTRGGRWFGLPCARHRQFQPDPTLPWSHAAELGAPLGNYWTKGKMQKNRDNCKEKSDTKIKWTSRSVKKVMDTLFVFVSHCLNLFYQAIHLSKFPRVASNLAMMVINSWSHLT